MEKFLLSTVVLLMLFSCSSGDDITNNEEQQEEQELTDEVITASIIGKWQFNGFIRLEEELEQEDCAYLNTWRFTEGDLIQEYNTKLNENEDCTMYSRDTLEYSIEDNVIELNVNWFDQESKHYTITRLTDEDLELESTGFNGPEDEEKYLTIYKRI